MRALFLAFTACTFLAAPALAAPKPLSITRITPDGENTEATRQIVLTFNRPVVPLGRMERTGAEIPITFSPAVDCQWRWLNPSALACQLDDKTALAPATRYTMEIGTAITAEDGGQVTKPRTHGFTTERPDVRYQWFSRWIDSATPVIRVVFTVPVTRTSAGSALSFRVNEGKDTIATIIEADTNDRNPPLIAGKDEARINWLVRPVSALPEGKTASLVLNSGLVTPLGPEKGVATDRTLVQFDTYPAFALQGLTCTTLTGEAVTLLTGSEGGTRSCDPQRPVTLSFTSPVALSQVAKAVDLRNETRSAALPLSAWGDISDSPYDSGLPTSPHRAGQFYMVSLPSLKAANTYLLHVHPAPSGFWQKFKAGVATLFGAQAKRGITDRFGRGLYESASITFATDHRRPNFVLPHRTAVIEQQADSEVPLYVNNLKSAEIQYIRRGADGRIEKGTHTITPPFVQDKQFAVPLGLRAMLGGKPGLLYGKLSTTPTVDHGTYAHRIFAQTTPYNVQAKIGHFASLVWVTDLATGKPVRDANISIAPFTFTDLAPGKPFASAMTDKDGVALLPGYASFDPKKEWLDEYRTDTPRLSISVTKGDAIALLPVTYDFEVDIWRASNETIYASTRDRHQHMRAWGTTAQGVYRLGDTIDYKLFVRDEDGTRLAKPAQGHFTLSITDPAGNTVHEEKDITLNAFGTYAGSYALSKDGYMGWYRFTLNASYDDMKDAKGESSSVYLEPMRVLVSDFTPAAFKVSSELNGERFLAGDTARATTIASLYSGGAYRDANARVTAQLQPKRFTSPSFEGFSFGPEDSEEDDATTLFQADAPLDDKGEHRDDIALPANATPYGSLIVESAVADDRGKFVAAESRVPFFGRDRFVGLKTTSWLYEANKKAALLYGVAGIDGKPVPGIDVTVRFEKQDVKASRVKSAGSTYQSQFITQWNKVGECKGTSAHEPQTCGFTPRNSGYYRAVATVLDSKGRTHEARSYLWVTGSDYVLWEDGSDNALPLVPEKTSYQVGDTARYLVRNPYPGATALITIERYGVIDHFVQVLEGSTPTISFPVKPDYLPGFYLSVTVMSPRVDKPLKVGEVDLGKPAYRLGYVEVPVTDSYKEITVTPKVAKEEYRPRDEVEVTLHAAPKNPGAEGQPIEVTAIVIDDAVFDLISGGRDYFDPYKGLWSLSGLDLENYSLLNRLVGRQKFEKKGANPGGDGGVDLSLRNLFKFVSYWNPSLPVDAKGNASFRFTVPDNLTRWRVLAIAATPNDRFGLGEASFRVNRPTEIRPVMPNQLYEGDRFTARFSVMNRTDKARELAVDIEAIGALATDNGSAHLRQTVHAEPYERAFVSMELPVSARIDHDDATISFTASAQDASDGDAVEHTLPIKRALPLVTAASMESTDGDSIRTSLDIPKAIRTDVSDVRVVLAPSVIGAIDGAFRYMRDYPYTCWEQRITKALMASQSVSLRAYLPTDFVWKDAKELPAETLKNASSFQAPNGGMAYFRAEDAYADPYLSAFTAYAFTQLRAQGYDVPGDVEMKLHAYLLRLLKKDAMPDWYDSGMRSDIRAVALATLATHGGGEVDASDIERFAPHMKRMSLFGKAHFLRAALLLSPSSQAVKDTRDAILAQGVESAGTLTFNETLDDGYTRILASPLRDNCAVLSSLVAYREHDNSVDALPVKLARSITQHRSNRDHWENTQENLFCMQALSDMARVYERETPAMTLAASFNGKTFGDPVRFSARTDAPRDVVHPLSTADAGSKAEVSISKEGKGRFYATTRLTYSPTDGSGDAQNAGIALVREYSVERDGKWVLLKAPATLKRGEVVRVDLYASLPTARAFVVVDDPVAGALEPVNRDLATSSRIDADKGGFKAADGAWWFTFGDWEEYGVSQWSFYHHELGHAAVRYYADYLPAGNYHLSYSAQVIADGEFHVPAARAEAMYDPDIFGTSTAFTLTTGE